MARPVRVPLCPTGRVLPSIRLKMAMKWASMMKKGAAEAGPIGQVTRAASSHQSDSSRSFD